MKAFTIIELVVAMIISGIVIGAGYSVYRITTIQYIDYKNTNEKIIQIITLNSLINNNFANSKYIERSDNGITFINNQNKKVNYIFEKNYIIRNVNTVNDTFFMPVINLKMMSFNNEQLIPGTIIDELYFETIIFKKQKQFHFKKQYGADILMKLEIGELVKLNDNKQ